MTLPKRRQIRLDHELYADSTAVCIVTVTTQNRLPAFMNPTLARDCVDLLRAQASQTGIQLFAFCLMPDHLHLLLSPSACCGILEFVGAYKSLSTRLAWQQGVEGRLWQARFFDHFLRTDEYLENMVEYILHNPVRKGLVCNWGDYPYSGSSVYDLER